MASLLPGFLGNNDPFGTGGSSIFGGGNNIFGGGSPFGGDIFGGGTVGGGLGGGSLGGDNFGNEFQHFCLEFPDSCTQPKDIDDIPRMLQPPYNLNVPYCQR